MLNLYLVLGTDTSLKSIVFLSMVEFLQKHKQLPGVMIEPVRNIHVESQEWYLTKEERIDLYVKCAQALERENDSAGAFKVYFQAFKLINTLHAKEAKKMTTQAEQFVIAALKSPEVINFEEIMLLNAVKELKQSSQKIFNLVNAVTSAEIKAFTKELDSYKALLEQHKITRDMLLEKKRFITICSMDFESSAGNVMTFKELANILNLDEDDIEEWAITAINNDIIDARINQLQGQIIIKTHKLRQLNKAEWEKVKANVTGWKQRFEGI